MTEITAEGNASTTTTVIDNKNGSVPKSPGKVLKRTVTEDIVTTFSSPAAWLLVIALIITWSAVAIVMFDLVDYKNFSASSISKIGSDPLKFIHHAVEDTTDWVYGFFSLLSDIISSEGDEEDDDEGEEDTDKGEIEEPPLKKKEIRKEKTEKEEKPERKIQTKVTHREKDKVKEKEKEKPEKKATHREKIEKKEKAETKTVTKEEKKTKTKEKTEEKTKKELKGGKQEKVKQTAAKGKEAQKTSPKPKEKDEKETAAASKHEQKDQYAFCRYMIDMFVHGDLKPGQSPAIPPPLPTKQASRPTPASSALEEKEGEKKKAEKKVTAETKKKEKEDVKKKTDKETVIDVKKKEQRKTPETKQGAMKVTSQAAAKKDEKKEDSKKTKTPAEEQPKGKKQEKKEKHAEPAKPLKRQHPETDRAKEVGAASTKKAVPGKKEEKTTKTVEQEIRKEKSGKTSTILKDQEPIKGKEVKLPSSLKEKGELRIPTNKYKNLKITGSKVECPVELETKKDEKSSKAEPQVKKEEKPEPQVKKETKSERDTVKLEKIISHTKPEEKVVKQVKATTIEKTVKPKPAKKAELQEKESLLIKTDKRKLTLQTSEVREPEKKAAKASKDFEDVPASKKAKEETEDVSTTKKQKSPISFFQCVYLDGYNGYGFQFPVTPAQRPGESSSPSGPPGQKQQGQ
ncbi:triadin isoform X2 [Saccopteryx leptura]|uniref:triadin isoform X2 n=1 Tax=Saccopteryx leptura TaxID=249018 RepID=UPI00339C3FA8